MVCPFLCNVCHPFLSAPHYMCQHANRPSGEGRLVAVALMLAGMALLGDVTATITYPHREHGVALAPTINSLVKAK